MGAKAQRREKFQPDRKGRGTTNDERPARKSPQGERLWVSEHDKKKKKLPLQGTVEDHVGRGMSLGKSRKSGLGVGAWSPEGEELRRRKMERGQREGSLREKIGGSPAKEKSLDDFKGGIVLLVVALKVKGRVRGMPRSDWKERERIK